MVSLEELPKGEDAVLVHAFGPVSVVVINRPSDNNSINDDVRDGLQRAFAEIANDSNVRAAVLTSEGEEAFSVGADIAQLATLTPMEAKSLAEKTRAVYDAITSTPQPVIAAIKGACIGAGFELAMHCDIRFARNDARFGLPGVNVGIVPGGSSVARLSRLVGAGPARALCLTGGIISAERAFMLGLVSNVIEPDDFRPTIEQLAQHLCALSPVALRELKGMLNQAIDDDVERVGAVGPGALARCFAEGDANERLSALFGGPDPEATVH